MYILVSLGFAFIFNMMGTINLAHGALYMASALLCYYLSVWLKLNNWAALAITIAIMCLAGVLLERLVFRPFIHSIDRLIMVGAALMTFFQTMATVATGTKFLTIDTFMAGTSMVLGVSVSNERLLTFVIGLALLVAALILVNKTTLGRQMEAIAQDRIAAALQGVNINKVSAIVCVIGCALAAVAGGLMGAYQQITPTMGDAMLLRVLMLVMLAGAGSMNGLIITGFIIGLMDSVLPVYLQGATVSAISAGIVLALLLTKPKGFFGYEV